MRLERDMGLTPYTVTRMNIVRLLGQFHRFYSSWESWIEASPVDRDFFDPRRKLHLIGHDLAALGLAVPRTDHAERIDLGSPSLERAFGSLYVVEGSTLGGQVTEVAEQLAGRAVSRLRSILAGSAVDFPIFGGNDR